MNRVGIRAHDIGKMSAQALSEKVVDYGFDGVQLVFKKAFDTELDFNDLNLIKKHFTTPMIMMLGAYFNPVHPDPREVTQGIDYFKKHLEIAFSLNAKYVGTETGSLMGSPWGYVEENHEQKALDDVIEVIKDLVLVAEKKNSYIAIEGAYAHVAYSPKRIREILDQVNSPNLKVTIDLYNFLHIGNYERRMEIFEEALSILADEIVIFHLKDFKVLNNQLVQVGLGQGLMDYPTIIKRIKEVKPDAHLIFEGVTGDDIETSFSYIKKLLEGK
ncbi:MAG: sugar phosphate isomerase/epimerase family protein [Acholeplasmataceae bacterium]|nr:sugar phosphate isomerase/epimerase family protein [Acholeplasmataceae bacterium]